MLSGTPYGTAFNYVGGPVFDLQTQHWLRQPLMFPGLQLVKQHWTQASQSLLPGASVVITHHVCCHALPAGMSI
jgi:hypothetical protein